jgi:hypothetical protein
MYKQRRLMIHIILVFACVSLSAQSSPPQQFRLWASSDAHVGNDIDTRRTMARESLAEAIRQSEGTNYDGAPAFEWDIALMAGDFSGNQGYPKDDEGEELIRQFSALRKHRREQIYCLVGNHDASGVGESQQWWFRKWVDPTGKHTRYSGVDPSKRTYPVEGTWERYSFSVGNILFLIMGDRNDTGPPVGRGERGGYPAGAVSQETFEWWKEMVEKNQDKIIVSAHHHMLRETTAGTGPWEGMKKDELGNWTQNFHGYYPKGGPEGASYLYFVGGVADAQSFEKYLTEHPGAIDIWIGGHSHFKPEEEMNGRSLIEKKWGVNFINVGPLTKYHNSLDNGGVPMSRLLTFQPGSTELEVQCYLHDDSFANRGWHIPAKRVIQIGKKFNGLIQIN